VTPLAKCNPPFPEEEARQKIENAYRYEPGTSGRFSPTDTTDAGHRLRELSEAPPFPVEALPEPCRRLVKEAAGSIVCPPEFIAVPLLVALGSAIGTSRVARLKRGWTESAAVYAAIVALPGKKKTPALKVATEAARAKQGDLRQEYRDAKEDHEAEVRQWEADKKAAAKDGEPAPEQPQKPTMKRTVVDDTTVEALAAVLEGNLRGVLVTKDELSGWVRSMDQYKAGGKGTDRQFYLSAWSNSPVTVDRKNLEEPLFLLKPFVGVVGSVQPAVLSELTANRHGLEGDGLLDRFVFAYPEPMPSRWSDQEISAAAVMGARRLYEDLLTKLELDYQENGDPEPRTVDRELILELLGVLLSDRLPPRVRKELQSVVQLLQCYLRAAELEMRAAEEPLRSDLDVAGLKAQVHWRIEELEAREREREEMLAELVPAMESRGHDTGDVNAVMDRLS
jgi:putative DNA primase/helicase